MMANMQPAAPGLLLVWLTFVCLYLRGWLSLRPPCVAWPPVHPAPLGLSCHHHFWCCACCMCQGRHILGRRQAASAARLLHGLPWVCLICPPAAVLVMRDAHGCVDAASHAALAGRSTPLHHLMAVLRITIGRRYALLRRVLDTCCSVVGLTGLCSVRMVWFCGFWKPLLNSNLEAGTAGDVVRCRCWRHT